MCDAYEVKFGDMFPTFPMMGYSEEEMIKIIEECIEKNKDVYDLGYLTLGRIY